jgi:hypothetical protein
MDSGSSTRAQYSAPQVGDQLKDTKNLTPIPGVIGCAQDRGGRDGHERHTDHDHLVDDGARRAQAASAFDEVAVSECASRERDPVARGAGEPV